MLDLPSWHNDRLGIYRSKKPGIPGSRRIRVRQHQVDEGPPSRAHRSPAGYSARVEHGELLGPQPFGDGPMPPEPGRILRRRTEADHGASAASSGTRRLVGLVV